MSSAPSSLRFLIRASALGVGVAFGFVKGLGLSIAGARGAEVHHEEAHHEEPAATPAPVAVSEESSNPDDAIENWIKSLAAEPQKA
mmetsp:Transcript_10215/g.26762  ORF Transcript_10215/g.26762 Transcript_10215/m.26762 type:complete len:86 (+) Transcript_10215:41-298(+)|eukprot:CAMPEP_0113882374 /NCGR_PEP_ID=MMETSP0780_2-20120614/8920_1 /TAXON_ID=652834 /ORGANISM="Palpitomonas bilix" /LENGTH=85 /DNA_ID=CAMNT_0000869383 /DNA_START=41 /DNA_END=298 /DNA_ORIENTATION=- /assembly_acc=CAM_ASM_000599